MRTKRASTYQCCYICGQWGFDRADYKGTRLCVDCEADVLRQMSIMGGPGHPAPRKRPVTPGDIGQLSFL